MAGAALADLAGVSRQTISHYENGRSTPSAEMLGKLASVLGVPLDFLLRENRPTVDRPIYFRSMAASTKGSRSRAAQRLAWLEDITGFVANEVELPAVDLPDLGLPRDPLALTDAAIEEVAEEMRSRWGLADRPIQDMTLLLEHHGVIIGRDDLGAASLEALSAIGAEGRPHMLAHSEVGSPVRWRFGLAHELGHLIMHRGVAASGVRRPELHSHMEHQAHRFASAFLLPIGPFADDLFATTLDGFKALKPKWKVSIQMMIMRARQAGLIREETERNLWVSVSRRKWRSVEPLDAEMTPELPSVLRRALELIVSQGGRAGSDVVDAVGIPARDIESLAGLDPGYLSGISISLTSTSAANVVPFPGRSGR